MVNNIHEVCLRMERDKDILIGWLLFPRDLIASSWDGLGRTHSSTWWWPSDGSQQSPFCMRKLCHALVSASSLLCCWSCNTFQPRSSWDRVSISWCRSSVLSGLLLHFPFPSHQMSTTLLPFFPHSFPSLVLCWPQSIRSLLFWFFLAHKPHYVLCSKQLFYVIILVYIEPIHNGFMLNAICCMQNVKFL